MVVSTLICEPAGVTPEIYRGNPEPGSFDCLNESIVLLSSPALGNLVQHYEGNEFMQISCIITLDTICFTSTLFMFWSLKLNFVNHYEQYPEACNFSRAGFVSSRDVEEEPIESFHLLRLGNVETQPAL